MNKKIDKEEEKNHIYHSKHLANEFMGYLCDEIDIIDIEDAINFSKILFDSLSLITMNVFYILGIPFDDYSISSFISVFRERVNSLIKHNGLGDKAN